MKFGQLIEYHMRNIFLEKSYTECRDKSVPDSFIKTQIENISGSTVWNSYYKVCFIVCLIWGLPKFITLYCIDWPSLIAWLSLLHEILGNICIIIICYPVCDVINFEIKHSFLIKLFFYIIKKSGWKCKYLKNKKSF